MTSTKRPLLSGDEPPLFRPAMGGRLATQFWWLLRSRCLVELTMPPLRPIKNPAADRKLCQIGDYYTPHFRATVESNCHDAPGEGDCATRLPRILVGEPRRPTVGAAFAVSIDANASPSIELWDGSRRVAIYATPGRWEKCGLLEVRN